MTEQLTPAELANLRSIWEARPEDLPEGTPLYDPQGRLFGHVGAVTESSSEADTYTVTITPTEAEWWLCLHCYGTHETHKGDCCCHYRSEDA